MRPWMRRCALIVPLVAALLAAILAAATPDHSHLPPQLRPHRPAAIRILNFVGRKLLGDLLPDETALVASACKAAALPPGTPCELA